MDWPQCCLIFFQSGRLIVCCPDGFWRQGNVDIVCVRYGIPQAPDLPALIELIRERLALAGE